jgi:hypothetical protein
VGSRLPLRWQENYLSVSSQWHCHALGIPKSLVPLLGISTAIEITGKVHASLTGTAIFWVYQTRR